MNKPKKVVFLSVLFLSVFSAGCSNQGNNLNKEISDSQNWKKIVNQISAGQAGRERKMEEYKMKDIRVGFIGLGCRGISLLRDVVLRQGEQVTAIITNDPDMLPGRFKVNAPDKSVLFQEERALK